MMVPLQKLLYNISPHVTCTRCSKPGHYALACPFLLTGRPQQHFQQFFSEPHVRRESPFLNDPVSHPGAIIVDSGSSFNSIRNIGMLHTPIECPPFESYSNSGGLTYTVHGQMRVFSELNAYYSDECMANIVSLDLLEDKYHVFFNSELANSFTVTLSDGHTIRFDSLGTGLYIHNLNSLTPYSFVNTVTENKSFYTHREVQNAEKARD